MCDNNFELELKKFNDKIIRVKNVDGIIDNVPQYLGKIDADNEWNDNPIEANSKFLHTQSYNEFTNPDALILLGRTGTGKTSIIRCLCDSINKSDVGRYGYNQAVVIPFDPILRYIVKTTDDFNSSIIHSEIMDIISIYINCYVMKYLIGKHVLNTNNSAMARYIQGKGLLDVGENAYSQSGFDIIEKILHNAQGFEGNVGIAINNLLKINDLLSAFKRDSYEDAYLEMRQYLMNNNILVLIDTMNEYDLRDIKQVISVKALIATCFEYYKNIKFNKIYVKISIPSEIHTHLIEQLPGKQQGNTVVIKWRTKDLLKMIAIRLLYYYINNSSVLSFASNYEYKDFYDSNPNSYTNAKKLLYEILPENCPSSLNFSLDTLAYCVRHTLKKPRELMSIINTFLKKIFDTGNTRYYIDNPDEIRDSIHSTQEEMVMSALSMYSTSYPNIATACTVVLKNRMYYFKGLDLEDSLKEAVVLKDYGIDDIKRILLESGLIGKLNEISYQNVDNVGESTEKTKLTLTNSIRVFKAKFEYQVKGRLSLNRHEYYVLHPMCYEHFECMLGTQTLVYPDEIDNDVMKSVRLKEWIK